jgi:hypothetical protein
MRYRIPTVTAIALAMLAFHGCGDDAKPAPDTTKAPADAAKPADAKPADAAKPAEAKPADAPAAPAAPAK